MHTDPISDFLNRLKNASKADHDSMSVPYSNIKLKLAEILKKNGYITDAKKIVDTISKRNLLEINLSSQKKFHDIQRKSKPGQKIYTKSTMIKRVKNNYGIGIYSTSQGILTDKEARKLKIGGEYLCEIY